MNDAKHSALMQALEALKMVDEAGAYYDRRSLRATIAAIRAAEAALAEPVGEPEDAAPKPLGLYELRDRFAQVAQPDWTTPTTAAQRMTDAVALLCSGKRPPEALVTGWIDGTDEGLQDFAAEYGPAWAQGIGLLDAARVLADQPTEGVEHEQLPAAPAPVAQVAVDALRADAERYRWLRDTPYSIDVFAEASAGSMDEDVDAARSKP